MAVSLCWIRWQGDLLVMGGELSEHGIAAFERELTRLPSLPQRLTVDLSEFEIQDGIAVVAAVNALRQLAQGRSIVLISAPQLLAHNLYRVAALEDGHITLQATREEEPYG